MPNEASLANLRPFAKGQNGFLGHQPKGHRKVLALARKNSPEAMETIIACMRDPHASWRERITAATVVLERAWGKPKEHMTFEGADGANILVLTGVPRNELQEVVQEETNYTIDYEPGDEEQPE